MGIPRMLLLLLLAALTADLASCQCSLSFTLPNIIKDLVSLTYSNGQESSSSYPYFPSMFSSNPNIAYSISQLDILTSGAFLNFYLDVDSSAMMMITFYFNAPTQTWTKVTLNIWITSRNDLIVRTDTLQNIPPGQSNNLSISLAQYTNNTITANAKHLLFIVGMYSALIGNNFTVNITAGPINPSTATITVTNGYSSYITNITVTSVIFDPSNSQFLSNGGTIAYQSFTSQSLNLYSNFLPIYYYLVGVNSFSISGDNTRYFGFLMDVTNSTILSLSLPQTAAKYDSIGFSYLSVGVQTSTVCSGCGNNFISDSGCVDSCPASTFPYSYPSGGKACLQCSGLVGLKINDLGTGCSCLPGYTLLTTYQCIPMTTVPSNCSGQNVIQNGTACICSPGTYNISGKCQSCLSGFSFNGTQCAQTPQCPANSALAANNTQCVCNSGFMNISGVCTQCQSNQYYNTQLQTCSCTMMNQVVNPSGICICQSGYYNVSNFCIQCPDGTVYLNGVCAPTSCPENQVLNNGKCVCDSYSVKKGSACQKCAAGTFPNTTANLCSNCISNCANCNNSVTCQLCNNGFAFDFSSLSCISMGNTTSANVSLRTGFPVYTYTAIVIDFIINSAASLAIKNSQQLTYMIGINYPPSQPLPYRTIYKQFPSNLNQIRVAFDYRCLLPLSSFVVTFTFLQPLLALNASLPVTISMTSAQVGTTIPQ